MSGGSIPPIGTELKAQSFDWAFFIYLRSIKVQQTKDLLGQMRYFKIIKTIFILLLANIQLANAQSIAELPKILPTNSKNIKSDDVPSLCIENAFEAPTGRLWLSTCSYIKIQNNIHLFQFDGYGYNVVKEGLEQLQNAKNINFIDISSKGELLGYASFNSRLKPFLYNTNTHQFRFLPVDEIISKDIDIISVKLNENGQINLITQEFNQFHVYSILEDVIELNGSFSIDTTQVNSLVEKISQDVQSYSPIFQNDKEIWLVTNTLSYIRWTKKDNAVKIFTKKNLNPESPLLTSQYFKRIRFNTTFIQHNGKTYVVVYQLSKIRLFILDEDKDTLIPDSRIPESWNISFISSDAVGNVVFVFKDKSGNNRAILEDKNGRWFDYSAMVSTPKSINDLSSKNFKKEVMITSASSLKFKSVKHNLSIQHYLHGESIRKIIKFKDSQYLIKSNQKPWFIFDKKNDTTYSFSDIFCKNIDSIIFKNAIAIDEEGNYWIKTKGSLIKYDIRKDSCFVHETGMKNSSHIFYAGKHSIGFFIDSSLFTFNTISNKTNPVYTNGYPLCIASYKEHIYRDDQGLIWVATTSKGLWKIDLDKQQSETIDFGDDLKDNRFSCIHKDKEGKYWIGTFNDGIKIYDPSTGAFETINQENGLSYNTVASILEDDEGIMWIGTFKGISLISPERKIIANIYESDGLIDNENNRRAFFKTTENKLLFGTINGLNIIDPEKLKSEISKRQKPQIFLTKLSHYNTETYRDTIRKFNFIKIETIKLPAAQKYITLNFSLNSYIDSDENQFAYMLKGIDKGWTSLGTQNKLIFNNLPPGKYKLLIKGRNANGIWSANQLSIPIHAKDFFYKQYWFYLLCTFPFAIFAFLWIRRLSLEKLRMAFEIEKATEEIRKDKHLIEEQAKKLQELDQTKSRFFTNISHEFRTPLTIISGMIDQVVSKPDIWLKKGGQMIKENTSSLLKLVNQILELRKLESGSIEINMIQSDVVQYLRYIAESHQSIAENKGIQLHFLAARPLIKMDYDPDKLLWITSNLLSNAVKFTPKGGNIYFHLDRKNDAGEEYLQIRVEDSGAGIPEDQISNIFDRFYQIEYTPRRTEQGTGIGLAFTKELIKLLNGEIKVNSELGKGTIFFINLPITNKSLIQDALFQTQKEAQSTVENFNKTITFSKPTTADNDLPQLLIVEDNTDVAQFLVACLEGKYQLEIARNGQEGIDKAIEQIPDLIVSDVMMPKKDGFELCNTLKKDERTSHIPIILLTAKADLSSKISGLKQGADAYLTKPFEQEELLAHLKNLLELRKKLQEHYRSFQASSHPKNIEDTFILKVQKIVHENIDNDNFSIAQLCRALAMSRTQLHHKIKALTGKSTSLFIRHIRLQKGRALLQSTDLTVSEVAYEVGFGDPSHFSRFYKEEFGEAPSQTRK